MLTSWLGHAYTENISMFTTALRQKYSGVKVDIPLSRPMITLRYTNNYDCIQNDLLWVVHHNYVLFNLNCYHLRWTSTYSSIITCLLLRCINLYSAHLAFLTSAWCQNVLYIKPLLYDWIWSKVTLNPNIVTSASITKYPIFKNDFYVWLVYGKMGWIGVEGIEIFYQIMERFLFNILSTIQPRMYQIFRFYLL